MNIVISEKSPVYSKLLSLGNALALDPALLAAGMCHAALNAPQGSHLSTRAPSTNTSPAPAPPVSPAPAPSTTPSPAKAPAGTAGMFDHITD